MGFNWMICNETLVFLLVLFRLRGNCSVYYRLPAIVYESMDEQPFQLIICHDMQFLYSYESR